MLNQSADLGFKIESVLVCDDIRQEKNGKMILIGVYTGSIVVPTIPAALGLSIWMQARSLEDANTLAVKIEAVSTDPEKSSETIHELAGFTSSDGKDFILAMGRVPVQIVGAGYLSVQTRYGGRGWTEVIRKEVTIAPLENASST